MLEQMIQSLLVWVLPAFLVATSREAFRNQVIYWMGDTTPKAEDRLGFGLTKQIDPMGTFVAPVIMSLSSGPPLAWGHKTPIKPSNYKGNRKTAAIMVALSGSAFCLAVALITMIILPLVADLVPNFMADWFFNNLSNFIFLNCAMAIFHLWPILPLDGGWVVSALLPQNASAKYQQIEDYGILIIVVVIMILPVMRQYIGVNIPLDQWLLWQPAFDLFNLLRSLVL